jgi:hypothetical protein
MTNGSNFVPAAARVVDALLGSLVALIAIAFATSMLADYASNPGALWHGVHHDRNGHFDFGLNLALALRSLDLIEFVKGLLRATVWPPFHGLALASVLLFGGIDVRLAILPSLMGWCCTIVLTWLIARRLFSD